MTSPKRLDEVLEAQKAYDVIHGVRQEFLSRAGLMVESSTCVLSYPKLSHKVRVKITEIQRLIMLATAEVNRLEANHQKTINEYAFDSCGLSPGMVIRPSKKSKDRCVRVSDISIGEDGVLTASGWRVAPAKGPRRFRDSVKLATGLWRIERSESVPAIPAEEPSYPWSSHDKTWGMLVDSTRTGSRDQVSSVKSELQAIEEIKQAFSDLTRFIESFSTDNILQYRDVAETESATVDNVLAGLKPFPTVAQILRALNALADGIRDDAEWGGCLDREEELSKLDLLTAFYGIKAGDKLSVRYPRSNDPESWHTVFVARAWERTERDHKGEMMVIGSIPRKDGTAGKREDSLLMIPYEVEWRLADPIRESEARNSKYGDAKWHPPVPMVDYDTPKDVLELAGERFTEFGRALLFDAAGLFPGGIPITVVDLGKRRWIADWAEWIPIGGGRWQGRQGIKVTASHLGYAVGNQKQQAAVLLAAGLRQIAKDRYGRWCGEAIQRADGMTRAIGAIYPSLRNPYHGSTKEMMPESLEDDVYAANEYEAIGRRFTEEDLIRCVVNDVAETFRKNSLMFSLGSFMKRESHENGELGQLIGRTRL
jgi:hypothetical protein